MKFNWYRTLFVTAAIAVPAMAGARPIQTEFISVTYRCEREVELPVVFINDTQGRSHVIAVIDRKLLSLPQAVSASGARYRSEDTAAPYEFWNKGDTATISYGAGEEPEIIYKECVEIPKDDQK